MSDGTWRERSRVTDRGSAIPQLAGRVLFGDMVSGEVFHVPADDLPAGGQAPIRRVLLKHRGEAKTLLELIREKNAEQGRQRAAVNQRREPVAAHPSSPVGIEPLRRSSARRLMA